MKIVLYLFLIIISFEAHADICQEVPIIGFDAQAPYQIKNSFEYTGFDIEIIKKVLDIMGCQYRIEEYPWARQLKMLENKDNIILLSAGNTTKRQKIGQYSFSYYQSGNKLYVLKDKINLLYKKDKTLKKFNEIVENEKLHIGICRGYEYGEIFEKVYKNYISKNKAINKKIFNNIFYDVVNEQKLFDMAINKHIDSFITDPNILNIFLKSNHINPKNFNFIVSEIKIEYDQNTYFLLSHYFKKDFIDKFNKALVKLDKENFIKNTLIKYFDKNIVKIMYIKPNKLNNIEDQ